MFPIINTQLGNHPISLHLFDNGMSAFSPLAEFDSIIDKHKTLEVYIDRIGIEIIDLDSKDSEDHRFGHTIPYKQYPLLLEWLKSYNL